MSELTHVDEHGKLKMVDVGDKPVTIRRAIAEGRVRVSDALISAIQQNTVAKGNLLEVARIAGIQAAKRTDEIIPLCHTLPLEHVDVQAWVDVPYIRIKAEVRVTAKTGIEMEALTAVSAAALTVIDMGKAIDKGMVIEEIRLLEKTGGTRGDYHAEKPEAPAVISEKPMTVAVLTISDRCSRQESEDVSGPIVAEWMQNRFRAEIVASACVPDEKDRIAAQLREWALENPRPDLILTTGGTGLSPRDVTPEATASVLERKHPALLELARLQCSLKTPRAFLSRGEAGTMGSTLVINLPGSPRGAGETLEAISGILSHAIQILRGK